MLGDLLNSGAMPVLEATMRFSGQRQRILTHNIANLSTPNFQQVDVDPADFQTWLGRAVERRRETTGSQRGGLEFERDRQFSPRKDGSFGLNPTRPVGGVLAHDRNNRDVEKLMQDLAENLAAYQVATDLMRSQISTMRAAITERA